MRYEAPAEQPRSRWGCSWHKAVGVALLAFVCMCAGVLLGYTIRACPDAHEPHSADCYETPPGNASQLSGNPGSLAPSSTILVVGDWVRSPALSALKAASFGSRSEHFFVVCSVQGRYGAKSQQLVADAMAEVASESPVDLVVSVGDNFYESGLSDPSDETFDASFVSVYGHESLQNISWIAVLGNHDYMTNSSAQITGSPGYSLHDRDSRWNMPARQFTWRVGDDLNIIMFDSSPWLRGYREDDLYDFKGTVVYNTSIDSSDWDQWEQEQLNFINSSLQNSDATFDIAVSHHPIYSNSKSHGDTEELQRVNDVLKEHDTSLYMSGHDHVHQLIRKDSISYMVQGAGSDTRMDLSEDPHDLQFGSERQGFSVVETFPKQEKRGGVIKPAQMRIRFIDAEKREEFHRHVITRSTKGNLLR